MTDITKTTNQQLEDSATYHSVIIQLLDQWFGNLQNKKKH